MMHGAQVINNLCVERFIPKCSVTVYNTMKMSSHDLPNSVGLMLLCCRWTVTIFVRNYHKNAASHNKHANHCCTAVLFTSNELVYLSPNTVLQNTGQSQPLTGQKNNHVSPPPTLYSLIIYLQA